MATRIVPVTTLDPAQSGLAEAWNAVFAAAAVDAMGDDQDVWPLESRRAREASVNLRRHYVAAVDGSGAVLGSGEVTLPLRDNLELATIDVAVLPAHRRRGLGTLLLDHLTRVARDAGRTVLVTETGYANDGADPGEHFLHAHGFALAQTMDRNDLDVAEFSTERVLRTPGFAIETSTDGTLDEWFEDRAWLQRRMSTDAPGGDLGLEEETWDAERIEGDREMTRNSGRRAVESVARHLESGRLVGFTQLQVPMAHPALAYQQDTLVLREHRGHGLGEALKAANLRALLAEFPQTRTVRTWNARENGPMIAVNEALGYRPTAVLHAWRKRLA